MLVKTSVCIEDKVRENLRTLESDFVSVSKMIMSPCGTILYLYLTATPGNFEINEAIMSVKIQKNLKLDVKLDFLSLSVNWHRDTRHLVCNPNDGVLYSIGGRQDPEIYSDRGSYFISSIDPRTFDAKNCLNLTKWNDSIPSNKQEYIIWSPRAIFCFDSNDLILHLGDKYQEIVFFDTKTLKAIYIPFSGSGTSKNDSKWGKFVCQYANLSAMIKMNDTYIFASEVHEMRASMKGSEHYSDLYSLNGSKISQLATIDDVIVHMFEKNSLLYLFTNNGKLYVYSLSSNDIISSHSILSKPPEDRDCIQIVGIHANLQSSPLNIEFIVVHQRPDQICRYVITRHPDPIYKISYKDVFFSFEQ